MATATKQQRDRKLFMLLMIAVIAYWAMGLAATHYKREPYPALMMPDFLSTGGLEGTDYKYRRSAIIVSMTDGRVIESTLIDALVRNGYSRGQASVLHYAIAKSSRDEQGNWSISDPDHRVWDIAMQGISPDGPIPADGIQRMLLVYDHAVLDVRQWPTSESVIERLAECEVLPYQP